MNSKDAKTCLASEEAVKTSKVYTFDITKADAIFDQLLLAKIIKIRPGHNILKAEELKGKTYCKYHNSNKHTTNKCVVFRDAIQSWIDKGKLKFPEKQMDVDVYPFPSATISMVDACLPKGKGKWKAEWQPKEAAGSEDDRQTPIVMAESLQGQRVTDHDFETTIEESEKNIKLLIWPDEMKARFKHFRKKAEINLPPLTPQKPLIRVRWNLYPPFVGESLEYIREFHKKHSTNDLYGLPKVCQETLDLALTCPDAEQIIQKTTDPVMKARFQHICKAWVIGFEVDPYTAINTVELPFSFEDLQYLQHHFEIFLVVSLFGLTVDEKSSVELLDAYLDIRDARIAYEERARKALQGHNPTPATNRLEDDS
ncbi:hypothetical protein ACFX11_013056 [Malus domestica]